MNEYFDNSNHTNSESTIRKKDENTQKTKKVACKTCKACKAVDCGVCLFCKDKPKFGGPSKLKQRCLQRVCHEIGITPIKRMMLKQHEDKLTMGKEHEMSQSNTQTKDHT